MESVDGRPALFACMMVVCNIANRADEQIFPSLPKLTAHWVALIGSAFVRACNFRRVDESVLIIDERSLITAANLQSGCTLLELKSLLFPFLFR